MERRSASRSRRARAVGALALTIGAACAPELPTPGPPAFATVADRLTQYGDRARARMRPYFAVAGLAYPPSRVVLAGLKYERELLVYAAGAGGVMRYVRRYPVLAASGRLGPKLAQGDRQVPEGLYRIESLNPNSRYHLSLRIGYPNAFDLERAALDARDDLGGDIMIHGAAASSGCLAVGDEAAEDLFVLAADVTPEHVDVILSPVDFRARALPLSDGPTAPWVDDLYRDIRRALADLPAPAIEDRAPSS
jgi:hypothetical protein